MSSTYYRPIRSFSDIDERIFIDSLKSDIQKEIVSKWKEYVLQVSEDDFKQYLIDKYTLEVLIIDLENPTIEKPLVSKESYRDYWWENQEADVYIFTVKYNFSGSAILFKVKPGSRVMTSENITVDDTRNIVSFDLKLYKQDSEEFKKEKDRLQHNAFVNMNNVNNIVHTWNNWIVGLVSSLFKKQKDSYMQENDFFAAINIKVNPDTTSVFTAPTIKKITVPQPDISKKTEFASEPTMAKEMYEDVLKVIYDAGKSMEKKPSLYKWKNEEELRDQFLFILETRYDWTTATGETFNRSGKTDIILKYANDGSNLFIAECKFWHGEAEFLKAISQLFDRYLTWRDSKVSLIFFVTNKDFSNVIQTIKKEVIVHPYFLKENWDRGESSFSYIFHLPQDSSKSVYFEIMAFHYDK